MISLELASNQEVFHFGLYNCYSGMRCGLTHGWRDECVAPCKPCWHGDDLLSLELNQNPYGITESTYKRKDVDYLPYATYIFGISVPTMAIIKSHILHIWNRGSLTTESEEEDNLVKRVTRNFYGHKFGLGQALWSSGIHTHGLLAHPRCMMTRG